MNPKNRDKNNEFVRNVMARTSGSPCERACGQLPDLADGLLEELDRQLVQAHLEHCTGCRSVAVVLGWVQPLLPEMAELDPGPAFTQAVVVRTTGALHPLAHAARRGETVGPLGVIDRVGRWWQEQIFRPRFAMEVAYVATVILVLLTSVPGAPLRQEASQAREMVLAGPRAMPLLGPLLTFGENKLDQTISEIRDHANSGWQKVRNNLDTRLERTREPRAAMMGHLELAWSQGGSGQLNQAGFQLLEAANDFRLTWKQLWLGQQETNRINPKS